MVVPPTNKSLNESLPEVIRRITAALKPEKIYLFGSHAWGEVTQDSDIDLLVIVKESSQPAVNRNCCCRGYRLRSLILPFFQCVLKRFTWIFRLFRPGFIGYNYPMFATSGFVDGIRYLPGANR